MYRHTQLIRVPCRKTATVEAMSHGLRPARDDHNPVGWLGGTTIASAQESSLPSPRVRQKSINDLSSSCLVVPSGTKT